jgi:hypothetical protein
MKLIPYSLWYAFFCVYIRNGAVYTTVISTNVNKDKSILMYHHSFTVYRYRPHIQYNRANSGSITHWKERTKLIILERFHMDNLSKKALQMNDIFAVSHNPKFDRIICYITPTITSHNTPPHLSTHHITNISCTQHKKQCDGFAQSIARQRLGKQSRGNEYATVRCPVLGNVTVTRVYNSSSNRRRCFLCGPCRRFVTDTEIA